MTQFLVPIDMNLNEIQNFLIQVLGTDPVSPVEGQTWYNSTSKTIKYYSGSATKVLGSLDQITAPAADVSLNSHKITNLATPTVSTDAATKGYVDSAIQGINWKAAVRVATTANGTLATAFENGDAIDGVTLATGDRILLKDQSSASENGIYTVNASGAPTRATDADTGTELLQAAVFVQEGTTNADTLWVNSTNAPITVNSTSLTFAQLSSATSYVGGAGLTLTGLTFAVGAGTGMTVNADDVALTVPVTTPNGGTGLVSPTADAVLLGNGSSALQVASGTAGQALRVPTAGGTPAFGALDLDAAAAVTGTLAVANGGTNSSTAAAARTALGVPGVFSANVGDGVSASIDVVHNLGTRDVVVQLYQNSSTWDVVICDIRKKDANTVTLIFAAAPTSAQYRVNIIG